jgi:uncharacterized protein (DUF697 family)
MLGHETGLEYGGGEYGELGDGRGSGDYGEFGEYGEVGAYGEYGEYGEGSGLGEYSEYNELGEGGGEYEAEGEFGELGEYGEFAEYGEYGESGGRAEAGLSEEEVGQLASELLEIASEEELEQFLGKLFRRVARGAVKFVRSPVGRALGGVLRQVAKRALPVVGGALGSMVAPGLGTAIGSKLGTAASGLFEVEFEGLPGEQAEFEVARRYVSLSAAAARNAAMTPSRPGVPPALIARRALLASSRTYAPGLYRQLLGRRRRPSRPGAPYGPSRPGPAGWARDGRVSPYAAPVGSIPAAGRWVRRGRRIIVLGV